MIQQVKHGAVLRLFVNNEVLALAKNYTLTWTTEPVERTPSNAGKWRSVRGGKCGWSLSADYLISKTEGNLQRLVGWFKQGDSIPFTMDDTDNEIHDYFGDGLITNIQKTALSNRWAGFNFQVLGDGELNDVAPEHQLAVDELVDNWVDESGLFMEG